MAAMSTDVLAQRVIEQARGLIEADGGDLRLLGVDGSCARVVYRMGRSEQCAECVLKPEDLRGFLLEMCARIAPHITAVELELDPPAAE
jgi:Fe-S cluster biogenesis protein NfuA